MTHKSHGQGCKVIDIGVIWKGFISWACMYGAPISYGSKVMAKVKVYATESQTYR